MRSAAPRSTCSGATWRRSSAGTSTSLASRADVPRPCRDPVACRAVLRAEHPGAGRRAEDGGTGRVHGLVLAFGLSLAVSRYESRRADVVNEANAIGTTYLL